ncbi:MAG: condensation domain-containing protein, partial [Acidobacteria bacterium]|nr:condensation domain-containing protein [Acidobacteriota bacterium]
FDFDSRETAALKEIVKQEEMTPYMALLTIFNILLAKLSGQEDIIIGTPIAARRHADLQNVIGMLVNTLPMRNFPSGDKVLKDFLQEVRLRTLEAYENQEYPFEVLVDKITIARDAGRNPVFDVMFNLLNQADYKEDAFENYEQRRYVHIKGTSKFDMELTAVDMGERLHFTLDYSTHLFKPGRIERFIGYYKNILQVLTRDTGLTIAKIEIMDAGEKEEVLRFSNGIEDSYEELKTIHGWFAEQVHKTPDNIALVGANRHLRACPNCLTYYELNEQADNLASRLREKGVGPDSIVGLMLERSVEMIIGILGIMKAGGAYLPLDIEYPVERIYFTLKDSSVAVLLTADHVLENMPAGFLKTLNTLKKKPFITPARERILDFNSLPLPDRSLVNYEKYHKYISSAMVKHSISIQATRGCPFKCIYCNKICTGKFVQRSAENVFTEIRRCYDFGIRRFTFIDDVFNLDEKNASTLLKTLIKNRMDVQLFFANGLRGDILSKEFIDLMVEAGAATICLALESGSQRLQKLMKKRLNLEKFKDNVHYITQKYPHIILELELIHGFPTETEAEAMETLDFLMDIKWVHFPDLHILKIYPHTDMYRLAVESGITEEQIARSIHLAYHEIPETLPFSKDFTRRYQAKFLSDYFFLKERLLQVLPYQMKILTEDELVQKYDSYLPYDIKSFSDILEYLGISREELGGVELLPIDNMSAPNFSQGMMAEFPGKKKAPGALRLLLLDLSLSFSSEKNSRLYDVVEAPLGLMYLLTYLNEKLGDQVLGKVLKSRIDFDSYEELKEIILDFKPDLVGIRTLSTYKEYFHRSVSLMRKWGVDVPIISGGPYATAEYSVMLQDDNVDLAVLGEGELTIAQLAGEMLKNNKKLPGDEVLKNIPGIAFVKSVDKTKASGKDCQILLMDKMAEESSRYPLENLKNINTPNFLVHYFFYL